MCAGTTVKDTLAHTHASTQWKTLNLKNCKHLRYTHGLVFTFNLGDALKSVNTFSKRLH